MDDDAICRPLFLHWDGAVESTPREWEPATILLPWLEPESWIQVSLDLHGRTLPPRLERVRGKTQISASWPRAGAGSWQLRLGQGSSTCVYPIQVRPAKLTEPALETLVNDLEERLPASIVIGLDRLGAFAGLRWAPVNLATLAQELEQVRLALDGAAGTTGLIHVLHEAARHPHHVLETLGVWQPIDRARRPVIGRLPAALMKPGNLAANSIPTQVVDQRVESGFDTYENRLLREFLSQVDRRLRALEMAATRLPSLNKSHGPLLAGLRGRLRAARQSAAFLDNVGTLRASPAQLTQVMLRRPAYRAALEGFIRFRRSARVRLAHSALELPTLNVPALFEAWGTLVVIHELLSASEGWKIVEQRLVTPGAAATLVSVLAGGIVLRLGLGDATVSLHLQRSVVPGGVDLNSLSFEQRPDIILEVLNVSGDRVLHVLDPKYKLAGDGDTLVNEEKIASGLPKKVDVDKMHAYRDAIRDSTGKRIVGSAAILYPGPDQIYADGIAALRIYPGIEPKGLREWITNKLEDATLDRQRQNI